MTRASVLVLLGLVLGCAEPRAGAGGGDGGAGTPGEPDGRPSDANAGASGGTGATGGGGGAGGGGGTGGSSPAGGSGPGPVDAPPSGADAPLADRPAIDAPMDSGPACRPEVCGVKAKAIAAGWDSTCALLLDGSVRCWGEGRPPVVVRQFSDVITLANGRDHRCLLRAGGQVHCWGANGAGELGNGTRTDSPTPVPVSDIGSVAALGVGHSHSCVLRGGQVWCWGYRVPGADPANGSPRALLVPNLGGVDRIHLSFDGTCAVIARGALRCWPEPYSSRIGSVERPPVEGVTDVAFGDEFACALAGGPGRITCWGRNWEGQLGTGVVDSQPVTAPPAMPVVDVSGALDVTAGSDHACALLLGGSVRCWGNNNAGQLTGAPSTAPSPLPVAVAGLPPATALSAGDRHTCAVVEGGHVYCWGSDTHGQIGDSAPGPAPGLRQVLAP